MDGEEIGSRQRGRGIAGRSLVPEPTSEAMPYVMDFAPAARLGGTPHHLKPANTKAWSRPSLPANPTI
jgi:hypothetical protein